MLWQLSQHMCEPVITSDLTDPNKQWSGISPVNGQSRKEMMNINLCTKFLLKGQVFHLFPDPSQNPTPAAYEIRGLVCTEVNFLF